MERMLSQQQTRNRWLAAIVALLAAGLAWLFVRQ